MHYFAVSKMNKKKVFFYVGISPVSKINRTLHGRLGIRILFSRAESISSALEDKIRIPAQPRNLFPCVVVAFLKARNLCITP